MDNSVRNEGYGKWHIQTYQPESQNGVGPYEGVLLIDSKLYIIKQNDNLDTTIAVVPSQNVAYVVNVNKR